MRDAGATAPRGALPPDTNAVADGPPAGLDQIQEAIRGIDDDGAGRVAYRRFRLGAQDLLVNLAQVRSVEREALIGDGSVDPVRADIEPAEGLSRRDANLTFGRLGRHAGRQRRRSTKGEKLPALQAGRRGRFGR